MLPTTTRQELDKAGCGDHTVLFLSPRCHQGSPVEVSYSKLTGNITICCHKCGDPVTEIAVAAEVVQPPSLVDLFLSKRR